MIIIPTQASSLPPGPGYEHVDSLLITLVSGSGLDAVKLSRHCPNVVHEAEVPGNRQIISSKAFQFPDNENDHLNSSNWSRYYFGNIKQVLLIRL